MGWIFGGWPPPAPGAGGAVDIGDPVGGGSANSILFIDAAGKLAQDPGRFEYDKVARRFLIGPGTTQRFSPSTADADSGRAFADLLPAPDTGPSNQSPPFSWTHERVLNAGVWDHVIKQGWNLPGGVGHDASRGTIWDAWESGFTSPTVSERHLSFSKPGGSEVRALTIAGNWATGAVNVASFSDDWKWLARSDGAIALELQCPTSTSWALFGTGPSSQHNMLSINGAGKIVLGADGSIVTMGPGELETNDLVVNTGFVAWVKDTLHVGGANQTRITSGIFESDLMLNLAGVGAGNASLKLPTTAIVPVGALVRFKVQDQTGAVYYLTGQAA